MERKQLPNLEQQRLQLAETLRQHPESRKAAQEYAKFMRQHVIPQMRKEAQPYSFQEYFALALSQATRALEEGNYAIGAVYVYRANGKEIVVGGRNKSVQDRNTHEHAEEHVIDGVEALDRNERIERKRILLQRTAPHDHTEKILVASLEPCIGCYRRITTHQPNSVWIATPDETAGAMIPPRDKMLPPFWQTRREKRGIEMILPSNDPSSIHYINPQYRIIALEMFETTQKHIDATIKGTQTEPQKFLRNARQSGRRIFRRVF